MQLILKRSNFLGLLFVLLSPIAHASQNQKVIQTDQRLWLVTGEKKKVPVTVEEAKKQDFEAVSAIDWENFSHDHAGFKYAKARVKAQWNRRSNPLSRYYVIRVGHQVAGFALWVVRSGYKETLSVELERLAISKEFREKHLGLALARFSVDLFEKFQQKIHPELNLRFSVVLLTTGSDNVSHRLYERALGVESKGKIGAIFGPNAYGDEEIMFVNEHFDQFALEHPIAEFLTHPLN